MNWKELYKSRITTAAKAVNEINNGDHVVFSQAAGVPLLISEHLYKNKRNYRDVNIFHMLTLGEGLHLKPECQGHFHHLTNFAGANSRKNIENHQGDFIPCYFKDVPAMLGHAFPVDVAVISVSHPDTDGFCSFGVSCDYAKAAAQKAKIVIAEMNEMTPFTFGPENKIHVSDIDHIVPCAYKLPELPKPTIGDTERKIGEHCAALIQDGATLQLGIGAIPDAVLLSLADKKDLGIHTEMFSDSIVDLVEAGIINNAKKTLHKGKIVTTFIMGSKKVYDFVDGNPTVNLYPVDYVNNPWTIGKNDKMVSINSCIEIDLMGQVASESMGLKQFSGTGGQVDFVRGASMSKNGISVIAIPSTAANGTVSRIVPFLTEGATVTTTRNDVDYVVTEYGIAKMKGLSLGQRARNLIAIAHPDFRIQLQNEYLKRFQ